MTDAKTPTALTLQERERTERELAALLSRMARETAEHAKREDPRGP